MDANQECQSEVECVFVRKRERQREKRRDWQRREKICEEATSRLIMYDN